MIGQSLGGLLMSDYDRQRQQLLMQQAQQVPAWMYIGNDGTIRTNVPKETQPEPNTVLLLEDDDAA